MSWPRLGSPVGVVPACVCALFLGLAPAAQPTQESPPPFVPGEVLVQYRPGVAEHRRAGARSAARARVLRRFAALEAEYLRLDTGADPRAVVRALRADPNVRAAQPNYLRRIHAPAPPNDFFWLSNGLWGMQRIHAQPAWVAFGGGPHTVVIANIDTGVNYNHPDLAANMWRNPREIPGNGIDDDGNGYIDDVYGIDTVNRDSDPFDDHGHGTHTAGTAAAVANNEIGVAGVAWNARILACKFIDANGIGPDAAAVGCFNYVMALKAQGVNVRVTSNSWGHRRVGEPAAVLRNVIEAAGQAGILNVFAAGNDRTNNDVHPFDPASFPSPGIISVAGSGEHGDTNEGNYGPRSVHLAAPGANIVSTYRDGYGTLSGTSSAAAHVAGAAALLFSHHPGLTVREARDTLLDSVDRAPGWHGAVASGGILDVYGALAARGTNMLPTVALTSPADGMTLTAPATIRLAASAFDRDGRVTMVDFRVNGASVGRDTSAPFEWTLSDVAPGTYAFTAVATDNLGATAASPPVTVTVRAAVGPTPFRGTPVRLPGTVQAEDFDQGGQGVAYFDRTPGNSGGAYRMTDVDIEHTTDTGGGHNLGWAGAGEWLHYTVDVATAGTFDIEARVASPDGGGTFRIEVNGVDRTGPITVPRTGGWQNWTTIRRSGVSLGAGVQVWRVVMVTNGSATGAVGNFNHFRVVSADSTPHTAAGADIVLRASDVRTVAGNWTRVGSWSGAGGEKMQSADRGWATTERPLAAPADYFEADFTPDADRPYRVWLRLRAGGDSKFNDSVWVQFSGAVDSSGGPRWRIGSSAALLVNLEACSGCGLAGWGWHSSAWWLAQSTVVQFPSNTRQTVRIQTREDGVEVDQIVLSPATYLHTAPGSQRNDTTIVPRP